MLGVGVVGLNHKTANLALREALAKKIDVLKAHPFSPYPTVVLSTCNRVEIYFAALDLAEAHSLILACLRKQIGVDFEQSLYSFFGTSCFFHLCKVASGLDSAIFLETEIQRQVRLAYAAGINLGSCMHFVFQKALKTSKEIRFQHSSAPFVSLYHAMWNMSSWKNKKILLIGYSEINRGLISFLKHKRERRITLCTQRPQSVGDRLIEVGDRSLISKWQEYDIIVAAGNYHEYVIQGKAEGPQVIFDLGMPRNIDPHVGVRVYNIEEIQSSLQKGASSCLLKEIERFIWEKVLLFSRLYAAKTQRFQESVEMELHL